MMFGWVDFSDEERRRASEVMNYVRYPGAIDELGFGVLRDAFANKLFPATSTLHTHARYYYLVSYLMKDIERKGAGKSFEELQQMLRDGEMRTARRLVAWTKRNGVSVSGITRPITPGVTGRREPARTTGYPWGDRLPLG